MGDSFNISDASVAKLFKHKYAPISANMYNGKLPILARINKSHDFVGDQIERAVPMGFQGGAGSGSLPTANRGNYDKAILSGTKNVYAVCEVNRKTIKQAMNEGAFVDALKESVKKTVEKFNWNMDRILFNDGTGKLGTLGTSAVTDNTGGSYSLIVSAATWKLANFEIRDYVNIEAGNTDLFEITAIVPSTRTITVQRISGSQVPADTDAIFLQGSENADPQGIKGILDATSSTKYGISIGYRWQATQKAAGGAGISQDIMNETMLEVDSVCGVTPNLIVTSYTQLRKLLNLMEDQKRYNLEPKAENLKGIVSFGAVEFMSINGPVPIIADRFCEADRMYFLNDEHMEICHAPDMGWADDEGFVFLRKAGADAYEARYAAYCETYIPPTMHGVVTGLSTSAA